ncbi:hypothetical protein Gotur_031689, partial [Gossypium turneri]
GKLKQENWGRRKIENKIIENEDDRLISFSKRCTIIYKKTSELSTLFVGEIVFIIFSPTGMPYSFCHPSVESVAKQFLNPSQSFNETIYAPVEALSKVRLNLPVQDFNEVHD